MKTRHIASGIGKVIAALGCIGAIGCGADVGTEGEGASGEGAEIGVTSQALTVNALTTAFPGTARWRPGTCKVTIDDVERMVVFGGYNDAGNGLDDAYMFTPGSGWTQLDDVSDTTGADATDFDDEARGDVLGINIAPDKCLFVGGSVTTASNAAKPVQALILDVDAASGSQWSKAGQITGRSLHAVAKCVDDVIIIGGRTAATGGVTPVTGTASVQRRAGATGSTAWTSAMTLPVPVLAFGFDALSDNKKFVLAGGRNASAVQSIVQAFQANEDCTTLTAVDVAGVADITDDLRKDHSTDHTTTADPRLAPVALFAPDHDSSAATDLVYVTAGSASLVSLPTDMQGFVVTWASGVAYDSTKRIGSALPNGHRLPTVAKVSANQMVMVGGENASSATAYLSTPINKVHTFTTSGTPSIVGATLADTTGSPANDGKRLGSGAEYLASQTKVFGTVGLYNQTGPLLLQSTESITP